MFIIYQIGRMSIIMYLPSVVLAEIFVLGVFYKKATKQGAYAGFIVSAIIVVILKYNVSEASSWSYFIITIGTSLIVGSL